MWHTAVSGTFDLLCSGKSFCSRTQQRRVPVPSVEPHARTRGLGGLGKLAADILISQAQRNRVRNIKKMSFPEVLDDRKMKDLLWIPRSVFLKWMIPQTLGLA